MYNLALHLGRKHFCCYCLQVFRTADILKNHVTDCFKINGRQIIKMPKNFGYVRFKYYERKIRSPFMF